MKSPNIKKIVEIDLCIGCGICAAICPKSVLAMQWNKYGEYNPVEIIACTLECGLCIDTCPFAENNENEDTIGIALFGQIPGIKHTPETGYYLANFVGYGNEKHRERGASGGVTTWLLEKLLTEEVIDKVICVAPSLDPEWLFNFQVFETPEDLRKCAGSAYYPVEMSWAIRYIIETPGRYAVTGLPCFIKAVRLAQKKNKKLQERIVVTFGLVCGQLKSKNYTDYLASLAGIEGNLKRVCFRGKEQNQPANNYYFSCMNENANENRIFWKEGVDEAWINRWFTPNACNYCDDIFAECADVVCMDAWLPEYINDSKGTNLVLVRSPVVLAVINSARSYLKPIPIDKVIKSQTAVVVIKRRHLAFRLYLDEKKRKEAPKKRVISARMRDPFQRQQFLLKEEMRVASRELWIHEDRNDKLFRETMREYIARGALEGKMLFPLRVIRYIFRKIWSA